MHDINHQSLSTEVTSLLETPSPQDIKSPVRKSVYLDYTLKLDFNSYFSLRGHWGAQDWEETLSLGRLWFPVGLAIALIRIFIVFHACIDFQRGSHFRAAFPKQQLRGRHLLCAVLSFPFEVFAWTVRSACFGPLDCPLLGQGLCVPYPQPCAWHLGSVNEWWWSQTLVPKGNASWWLTAADADPPPRELHRKWVSQ